MTASAKNALVNLVSECRETAFDVADRLADDALLQSTLSELETSIRPPDVFRWSATSTFEGNVGLALMCAEFLRVSEDEQWQKRAHDHLRIAVNALNAGQVPSLGLSSGLSGLGFTTEYLSEGGRRYANLQNKIDEYIRDLLPQQLDYIKRTLPGCAFSLFDAVTGISGTSAYLIQRKHRPGMLEILIQTAAVLTALTEYSDDLPNWFTPPEHVSPPQRKAAPYGNLNTGLAHGLAGPLAALSLLAMEGIQSPHARDAIKRCVEWFRKFVLTDQWGVNWPYFIPLNSSMQHGEFRDPRWASKAAWCYGVPGIARSLYLAAEATSDEELKQFAIDAIKAVLGRPSEVRQLAGHGICHGDAGLLNIVFRFAQDTGDAYLVDSAIELTRQLLAKFSSAQPLGFVSVDSHSREVANPGFLDGAAGVAMVLLSIARPDECRWNRLLLLS